MIDFIPTVPPIWQTSLAFDLNPSDTSCTLNPELLTSGIPIPAGKLVCISVDIGQPNPEYIIGTLTANVLTFTLRNIDPLDPTVSIGAFTSVHGAGAVVKITDFATIQIMRNILSGLQALQNPLISTNPAVNPTDVPNYGQLAAAVIAGGLPASTLIMGLVRLAKNFSQALTGFATITIASPAVITLTNHGLTVNDIVQFSTTGALPTGIVAGVSYYVIATGLTANNFEISATAGGTAINTSGTQSGNHSVTKVTPTALEGNSNTNDALAGASGTPSATNPFETENDTSNGATETATTISFTAPSTISDSGNGFVTAGFRVGDSIAVTGSASNNNTFTVVTVAAGVITVAETNVVNEIAGASDTIAAVTANKLVRRTSTSQIKVPTTPVSSTDAVSKSYADAELLLAQNSYEQNLNLYSAMVVGSASFGGFKGMTAETDGSVIYTVTAYHTTDTPYIQRFAKDAITGQYYLTHTVQASNVYGFASNAVSIGSAGLAVIGTKLYICYRSNNAGDVIALFSVNKADLTGYAGMTFSGAAPTLKTDNYAYTDGISLYLFDTGTQWYRYTIAGTVATNAASIANFIGGTAAVGDGTNVFYFSGTTLYKGTFAGASVSNVARDLSILPISMATSAGIVTRYGCVPIAGLSMYVVASCIIQTATTPTCTRFMKLNSVTKP